MTSKYLIIGATGALGNAFAKALQEANEPAILLVRNRRKAIKLFGDTTGFTLVEGDVNDTALLKEISKGVSFIFHGASVSYEHWATAMPVMTRNIIEAAEHSGATVIFPGNNYNFGKIDQPINEPPRRSLTASRIRTGCAIGMKFGFGCCTWTEMGTEEWRCNKMCRLSLSAT
ncbi:MAG: NmrA family NAD(P)-binding protein [Paracoccaceae bacterium]